jgi:hypothetical protein
MNGHSLREGRKIVDSGGQDLTAGNFLLLLNVIMKKDRNLEIVMFMCVPHLAE